jgi:hypothetical protein
MAGFLEVFGYAIRDRADMPGNPARRDDHNIRDGAFATQVDFHNLLSLHVVQAAQEQANRVLNIRADWSGHGMKRDYIRLASHQRGQGHTLLLIDSRTSANSIRSTILASHGVVSMTPIEVSLVHYG